jgi:hypothetical protein
MVTALQEVNSVLFNEVDQTMLLGDPSRPHSGAQIFERFRFAEALKGFSKNLADKTKSLEGNLSIGLDPESQILDELRLRNCEPFSSRAVTLHR